jgi:hypothetical protein
MSDSWYKSGDWFNVPDELLTDPVVKFLAKERVRAAETVREADDTLRRYVLRNAQEVPEEMLPTLTPLQAKTLDFIVKCYKSTGQSPTSQEIADRMGWSALNSAVNAVKTLCRKGYLHKTKGKWRSLVPLFNSKRERIKKTNKDNE